MDKNIERIFKINEVLQKSKISNVGYDSMNVGCFFQDENKKLFDIDFKVIKELPRGLNCNVKTIYEIIGNMEREIYLGEWTIMTIKRAFEIYGQYKNNGQKTVFDFGFRYMGMGHIEIVSCNLEDYSIFFHPAGGSNGYDRESNFQDIVKNGPKKYEHSKKNFNDWFYNINLEGQLIDS